MSGNKLAGVRHLAVNLALAVGGIIMAGLIVEVVLRSAPEKFFLSSTNPTVYFHPALGHKFRPNLDELIEVPAVMAGKPVTTTHSFRTNSQGWRDVEYSREKPADTFRIAVLGDSFTAGTQLPLEKIYPEVLEAQLNRGSRGLQYEVMNLAVDGYDLQQEVNAYRLEAKVYQPDLAIWQIYVGNDLLVYPIGEMFEGQVTPKGLLRKSYTLFFGAHVWRRVLEPLVTASEAAEPGGGSKEVESFTQALNARYGTQAPFEMTRHYANKLETERSWLVASEASAKEAVWASAAEVINRFQAELEAQGVPLLVVFVPLSLQYDDELWAWFQEISKASAGDNYDRQLPQKSITARLKPAVSYVDLTSMLQSQCRQGNCGHIFLDSHFNAAGHRQVAQVIYAWLRDRGWVKCEPEEF